MREHISQPWVPSPSQVVFTGLSLTGFLVDIVDTTYFKEFLAQFLIAVVNSVADPVAEAIIGLIF